MDEHSGQLERPSRSYEDEAEEVVTDEAPEPQVPQTAPPIDIQALLGPRNGSKVEQTQDTKVILPPRNQALVQGPKEPSYNDVERDFFQFYEAHPEAQKFLDDFYVNSEHPTKETYLEALEAWRENARVVPTNGDVHHQVSEIKTDHLAHVLPLGADEHPSVVSIHRAGPIKVVNVRDLLAEMRQEIPDSSDVHDQVPSAEELLISEVEDGHIVPPHLEQEINSKSDGIKDPADGEEWSGLEDTLTRIGRVVAHVRAGESVQEGIEPSEEDSDEPSPLEHSLELPLEQAPRVLTYAGISLIRQLGHGGFAEVFLTQDNSALKIPSSNEEKYRKRLQHEGAVLRHLEGVKGVIELFQDASRQQEPYLNLLYGGQSLREVLAQESANKDRVQKGVRIAKDLLGILERVHEKGVIHRDLKPENVLVDQDGRLSICDFGFAQMNQQQVQESRLQASLSLTNESGTLEHVIGGTLGYTSLKELRGELPSTIQTDLRAVGVILYNAIVGDLPEEGISVDGPLKEAGANHIVRGVVTKALQRKYASAKEMLTDLQRRTVGEYVKDDVKQTASDVAAVARTVTGAVVKVAKGVKDTVDAVDDAMNRADAWIDQRYESAKKNLGIWIRRQQGPWYVQHNKKGDNLIIDGHVAYSSKGNIIASEYQGDVHFVDLASDPMEHREESSLARRWNEESKELGPKTQEAEQSPARMQLSITADGGLERRMEDHAFVEQASNDARFTRLSVRGLTIGFDGRAISRTEIPLYVRQIRDPNDASIAQVDIFTEDGRAIDFGDLKTQNRFAGSLVMDEQPTLRKAGSLQLKGALPSHQDVNVEDLIVLPSGDILFSVVHVDKEDGYPRFTIAYRLDDKGNQQALWKTDGPVRGDSFLSKRLYEDGNELVNTTICRMDVLNVLRARGRRNFDLYVNGGLVNGHAAQYKVFDERLEGRVIFSAHESGESALYVGNIVAMKISGGDANLRFHVVGKTGSRLVFSAPDAFGGKGKIVFGVNAQGLCPEDCYLVAPDQAHIILRGLPVHLPLSTRANEGVYVCESEKDQDGQEISVRNYYSPEGRKMGSLGSALDMGYVKLNDYRQVEAVKMSTDPHMGSLRPAELYVDGDVVMQGTNRDHFVFEPRYDRPWKVVCTVEGKPIKVTVGHVDLPSVEDVVLPNPDCSDIDVRNWMRGINFPGLPVATTLDQLKSLVVERGEYSLPIKGYIPGMEARP